MILICLLMMVAVCYSAPTSDPEAIAKICRVAISVNDPLCKNGGYLRAENITNEPESCGECICPDGWAGVDCSLCTSIDACPPLFPSDGGSEPISASSCAIDSITPLPEESIRGKRISCYCGGDDSSTQWVCAQQKMTTWDVTLFPSNSTHDWATGNALALVQERAGTWSQDYALMPCEEHGDCYDRTRWDYAYPGVWDGFAWGCSWKVQECIAPSEGNDCLVYSCKGSNISCPSSYATKCPGWSPVECGKMPKGNGNNQYWQHNCLPGTFPAKGKPLQLGCKLAKDSEGFFQCYITQEGSYISSLGMKCKVGACLYTPNPPSPPPTAPSPPQGPESDPSPPPPPLPPSPQPPIPPPRQKIRTEYGLLFILGVMTSSLIFIGGYLSSVDMSTARESMSLPPPPYFYPPSPHHQATRKGPDQEMASSLSYEHNPLVPSVRPSEQLLQEPLINPDSDDARDEESQGGVPGSVMGLTLSWHSIVIRVPKPGGGMRSVLKCISGMAGPGQHEGKGCMMAILGPSGAGKTTLLDTLAGRRLLSGMNGSGHLKINGRVLKDPRAEMMEVSGYVQQDDILPGTLTTFEYLSFNAALRMNETRSDGGRPQKRQQTRVWEVISELGLSRVAHSFIGDAFVRGLSGGEKRRVSIGCELITRPGLLLLDEPTTGLDSTNAARVVDILSCLSGSQGVTVILSIHQPRPDIFRLMDRVLLLSGEGQVVFSGPTHQAEAHFQALGHVAPSAHVALADHMLDLVIRSDRAQVDSLVEAFSASSIWKDEESRIIRLRGPSHSDKGDEAFIHKRTRGSWAVQFSALSGRMLRNTTRHPFVVTLNFIATFTLSLVLAFVFYNAGTDTSGIQNRLGVLFFLLLYLSLMSLSSLPIWRDEKLLFMRERAAGLYSTSAYFASVIAFDLIPLRVVPPLFFALFTYPSVGLHPSCKTCILWFASTLIGANVSAAAMCMAIGALSPSNSIANMIGSLTLMLLLLFGGFLLNKDRVPVYCKWISDLSFFNYAYEPMAVNEFHDFPADFSFTAPIDVSVLPPLRITGDGVLKEFGFEPSYFITDQLSLWALGAFYCFVTYQILAHATSLSSSTSGSFFERIRVAVWKVRASAGYSPLEVVSFEDDDESSHGGLEQAPSLPLPSSIMPMEQSLDASCPAPISAPPPVPSRVILSWEGIIVKVKLPRGKTRVILNGISGLAAPISRSQETKTSSLASDGGYSHASCLFAIIGPSGAGKSTLLDVLSGRRGHSSLKDGESGEVRVNGQISSPSERVRVSGYVHQEVLLPGTSTVSEYLLFHAMLKMDPGQLSPEEHRSATRRRVEEVISELGLSRVAHSFIGDAFVRGLSGGEKRRVSIGCELITRPGLLLLDEPTTGLDSTNAARVVDILSCLSGSQGVTVILSIHQPRPDIFRLMDRVLLLSGEGQVVFSGPTHQAEAHFQALGHVAPSPSTSIADHMLDLVIRASSSEVALLVEAFRSSQVSIADQTTIGELQMAAAMTAGSRSSLHSCIKYEAPLLLQLRILAERLARQSRRHPLLFALNTFAAIIMSLGLGAIFWATGKDTGGIQDRFGSLFFTLLYLSLSSLSSLPVWRDDRLIFLRERSSGCYHTLAYFIAVVAFDILPLRLLPPFLFSLLSYPMIGLRPELMAWAKNLLALTLHNITSSALSMAIGAAIPSSVAASNMAGSLVILGSSLLGGFLLSRSQMPFLVNLLASLSHVRYSFEALASNEFHGAEGYRFTAFHHPGVKPDDIPHVDVNGDQILSTFGFQLETYRLDMTMLVVMTAILMMATFLLLKFNN